MVLITILLSIAILSQFGERLAAGQTTAWWLIFAFLIIGSAFPSLYYTVSKFFGFSLISNFILSALIFFLLIELFIQSASTNSYNRKLRMLVSNQAKDDFIKNQKNTQKENKTLIIIPCYNEEDSLKLLLENISKVKNSNIDFCIIDDGSQDNSCKIIKKNNVDLLVSHKCNIGVSGVLFTGFKIAKELEYEYAIQCDADGQHPVEIIPEFLDYAKRNNFDMLLGSRFSKNIVNFSYDHVNKINDKLSNTTKLRRFGSQIILLFIGLLFGKNASTSDPTSGFRLYSKNAINIILQQMPDEYPEPEIIAICAINKIKVNEIFVPMFPRYEGVSSIQGFKKIRYMIKVISALIGLRIRSLFNYYDSKKIDNILID